MIKWYILNKGDKSLNGFKIFKLALFSDYFIDTNGRRWECYDRNLNKTFLCFEHVSNWW